MSDRYIEKAFLYLLLFSFLLHVAIFAVVLQLTPQEKPRTDEAQMLDLKDVTELPPGTPQKEVQTKRRSEKKHRVLKETAPKGDQETERLARPEHRQEPVAGGLQGQQQPASRPRSAKRPGGKALSRTETPPPAASGSRSVEAPRSPSGGRAAQEPARGEGIFKRQGNGAPRDVSNLFPSAGKLARLEESYRKKYGPEVEDGDTRFLNTDDILFGSFLRRFETAVYGVWHYPEAAILQGIQGVTPVKITFNRNGQIQHVELLESSGSKILDDEVFRSLRIIGPIGSFPKGYPRDTFNLIAFFQYGIGGSGRLR